MPNQALNFDVRDDATEVLIRLEIDGLPTFFEWFEMWFDWLKQLAVTWYEALVRALMDAELGERYGRRNAFDERACPECGCSEAMRKGWRSRKIEVPRLGCTVLRRPYVSCRSCRRSWAPYDVDIGLRPRRRYQPAALLRPVRAALDVSYARASQIYPESPSAMTLWRFIQRAQPPLEQVDPAEGTCVVDATLIPGDGPRGQMPVGVAHVVSRGAPHYGRATLKRRVVATVAGREEKLRTALQDQDVDTLLHDGRIQMRDVARRPARCRWHVPHMLRKYWLYQDGIKGARNRAITDTVSRMLYSMRDAEAAKTKLTDWIHDEWEVIPNTARHLLRSVTELIEPLIAPEAFTVVTTAPAEREMREINRRMENGSRWSVAGAEAFLRHHQVARHDPARYRRWLIDNKTNGARNPDVSQT